MRALLKAGGKWMGGVSLAFALVFLSINASDEVLNPELVAILEAKPTVAPGENGFFYLMGLDAPTGQDPITVGQAYSERLRQAEREFPFDEARKIAEEGKGSNALRFVGKLPSCDWKSEACLKALGSAAETVKKMSTENAVLLERYADLLRYREFEDGFKLSLLLFRPNVSIEVQRLHSALAAMALREGRYAEFSQRMKNQAEFSRVQMRGNNSLITKLLGMAYLGKNALLVSEGVRSTKELARHEATALLEAVAPMSQEELRFGPTLETETRIAHNIIYGQLLEQRTPTFWQAIWDWLTFKRNASQNFYFSLTREWLAIDAVPTQDYLAAESRVLARIQAKVSPIHSLELLYNPMGKILVSTSWAERWADYYRRNIDIDGLLRLVSLQVQIAAQGVKEADIPAFLAKSDPKYHDPYTGQHMQWSKERGLHFRGHSDRLPDQGGWVSIKL